jgi:PPOX class probable F420-dependent enzyme
MADLKNPKVQKILLSKAFAHLATIGPDGAPQSSPMWFLWDGEHIKFTHTTNRKKYQNIQRDPRIAVSITDVDDPYTYAEFRGIVERIEEDPTLWCALGRSWRSACDLIYEDSAYRWSEPLGMSRRSGTDAVLAPSGIRSQISRSLLALLIHFLI